MKPVVENSENFMFRKTVPTVSSKLEAVVSWVPRLKSLLPSTTYPLLQKGGELVLERA